MTGGEDRPGAEGASREAQEPWRDDSGLISDVPTHPPRCGCGSTAFVEASSMGWALVRFNATGPEVIGKLPVRPLACRECGAVILLATFIRLTDEAP